MKLRSTNNKARILIAKELEAVICAKLIPLTNSHTISIQTQKSVLFGVAYFPGGTAEHLSKQIGLEKSTVSLALNALEDAGILTRVRHTYHDIENYINISGLKRLSPS